MKNKQSTSENNIKGTKKPSINWELSDFFGFMIDSFTMHAPFHGFYLHEFEQKALNPIEVNNGFRLSYRF